MAPLIKQLGRAPDMTVEQMARERDLIDQLNRNAASAFAGQEASIAALASLFRPIAGGRVTTAGLGVFTAEVLGCTVSLTGGNQRITFDEQRTIPTGKTFPTYIPLAIAFAGNLDRLYCATNTTQLAFFDFVLRNSAGGAVDPAVTPIAMAFLVFEA